MDSGDVRPLRLIPLGGLGEFGLNAMVLDWEGHLLLVDAGAMFPSSDMPGVDSVVPDFAYLAARPGQLHGILLTHGHEDHIGSLGFALQAQPAPVYGSPLTVGFAQRRLQERGIAADLRSVTPHQTIEAGPFHIHALRVAHSVTDCLAWVIETPAGNVVFTGDFKIDASAPPDQQTDLDALSAWGDRGVLALLSDSTNVEHKGRTGAEDDVIPAFADVFARTPGRVLVSCFATAMPRIQRVADLAVKAGRRIAFVGRRMADNTEVARGLGLLRIPEDSIAASSSAGEIPAERVCLFVSGSQGEPLSALSMISIGEHRDVSVGPGDTTVISARPIPGNERAVSAVMGNLFRRGCDVVHGGIATVHVSGHASRDELVDVLQRVRPRFFVPVHGEYRMLAQHARLAREAGVPADGVRVVEDGEVLALGPDGAQLLGRTAAGRTLLDRSGVEELADMVVRDRRHLSSAGVVVPVVVIDRQTGRVQSPPDILTRGVMETGERWAELLPDALRVLVAVVEPPAGEPARDVATVRENIRLELRRFFRKRAQRKPIVIPVVLEV